MLFKVFISIVSCIHTLEMLKMLCEKLLSTCIVLWIYRWICIHMVIENPCKCKCLTYYTNICIHTLQEQPCNKIIQMDSKYILVRSRYKTVPTPTNKVKIYVNMLMFLFVGFFIVGIRQYRHRQYGIYNFSKFIFVLIVGIRHYRHRQYYVLLGIKVRWF